MAAQQEETQDTPEAPQRGVALAKGQDLSLSRAEHDLSEVTMAFGWTVRKIKKPFYTRFFTKNKTVDEDDGSYDLDLITFLCGEDGKVAGVTYDAKGKTVLRNKEVVFYNQKFHPSGKVWLTADLRTGGSGADDHEQVIMQLNDLPSSYGKLVFVVQHYRGLRRGESFANVENAYLRMADRTGKELLRFDLAGDATYADACSVLFAELARTDDGWKFTAIGKPYPSDSFGEVLKEYAGSPYVAAVAESAEIIPETIPAA